MQIATWQVATKQEATLESSQQRETKKIE